MVLRCIEWAGKNILGLPHLRQRGSEFCTKDLLTPTISALTDIKTSLVESLEMSKCQDIGIMIAELIFFHGGDQPDHECLLHGGNNSVE